MLPEGKYDCKNIGGETVEYRWNIEQTKRKLAWFSPPSSNDVLPGLAGTGEAKEGRNTT